MAIIHLITLSQLVYFCAIGRTGSYTRASEELDVSEPVVHRAVKRLERTCGARLVARSGNKMCLTDVGRAIYDNARQVASLTDLMAATITEGVTPLSGNISIGAGTRLASYVLPKVIGKWLLENRQVHVSITTFDSHQIPKKLLQEGKLDLMFTSWMESGDGLRRQLLFNDSIVVVSSPTHALAKSDFLTIDEFSKEMMIAPPLGSSMRKELEQIEREYGVQLRPGAEISGLDTIKQFCKAGVGLAVLPRSMVIDDVASNQLRCLDVEGFPRSLPCFVAFRGDNPPSPAIRSLLLAVRRWDQGRDPRERR